MTDMPGSMSNGMQRWDLKEEDNHWNLQIELPGFGPEDVSVQVEDNILSISAKHENVQDDTGKEGASKFYSRSASSFSTRLPLPSTVEVEGISAEVKKGILSVNIPKKPEKLPERNVINISVKGHDGTPKALGEGTDGQMPEGKVEVDQGTKQSQA
jgi:HSP20 family protein